MQITAFSYSWLERLLLLPWQGSAYTDQGKVWKAQDIALKDRACGWMKNGFMSVDTTSGAGKAFLRSLYEQYAAWGVDFGNLIVIFNSSH